MISKIWSKVEKPVTYCILIIYITLQMLSWIFEITFIDNIIEGEKNFLFIAIILFFLILFIDRRVSTLRKYESLSHFPQFDEAIEYAFKQQKKIKKLFILGHSTLTIYEHIKWKLNGKENIKILIRNPNSNDFLKHITSEKAIETEKQQIKNAVNKWKGKLENNDIKSLDVHYYDFEPSLYLIIIDEKMCVFGAYEPCETDWGYKVEAAMVIDGRNEVGKLFVDDLSYLRNSPGVNP